MKKIALLLSLAVLLPSLSLAMTTDNSIALTDSTDFISIKDQLKIKNYLRKKHSSGLRSWEFEPYVYTQERLQHLNVGANQKPTFPGIEYRKLCYHWKNCLKRVYKASNGYDQAYKNYSPKTVTFTKAKERTNTRGKNNVSLPDSRSGNYKLWNWTLRNQK